MGCKPEGEGLNKTAVAMTTAGLLLAGCATSLPSYDSWSARRDVDAFTDVQSCRVTLGDLVALDFYRMRGAHYYPVIERRGDEVRVGLMSHPTLPLPVGRIQIRVDSHEAWTIDPSETPVDRPAVTPDQIMAQLPADATPEQRAAVERSVQMMSGTITQSTSPYTVATGARALEIIDQMRTGQQVIFRTVGANSASYAGNAPLGASFNAALASCGI